MVIKKFLFNLHYYGTMICTYGWLIHPYIIYIQYSVFISWLLNKNRCVLTQIEYFLFNETFMGKERKFKVSCHMRYELYINLLLSTLYRITYNQYLIKK